ncbi:MAG: peptide-methionine (S)-S-oxide reductase MsrA [Pseudomonadales bacterium]
MKYLLCALLTGFSLAILAENDPPASTLAEDEVTQDHATAIFAGGCFWCMEPPFDVLPGVVATISGYAGGHVAAPSYRQVVAGNTGHLEVVQVVYDPKQVSFQDLLEVYWRNVDPIDAGGQFCDRGQSYTTAIFVNNESERALAKQSRDEISELLRAQVVTPIRTLTAAGFTAAEDYHQDYYLQNPLRYKFYRGSCGRDRRLQDLWGE